MLELENSLRRSAFLLWQLKVHETTIANKSVTESKQEMKKRSNGYILNLRHRQLPLLMHSRYTEPSPAYVFPSALLDSLQAALCTTKSTSETQSYSYVTPSIHPFMRAIAKTQQKYIRIRESPLATHAKHSS